MLIEKEVPMKKRTARQNEMEWGEAEDFALIQETAPDFDRIQAEQKQREKDKVESQSKNLQFDL